MKETIESIIVREASHRGGQQSLDRGLRVEVLTALNQIDNRGLVSLPGEGDLGVMDLEREVDPSNVQRVSNVVRECISRVNPKS